MSVLLRRLWIQVTADRKRFGALCFLIAIGMLLWARIIVTTNLPREAVATEDLAASVDATRDGMSGNPEAPPKEVALAEEWRRDPLVISGQHFPKPTPVRLLPEQGPKSSGNEAENDQARLIARLEALVDRFRLEAVMQGHPMAVINGQSFMLHDLVPAVGDEQFLFELVEVGDRAVVLECQGFRYRLGMTDPGIQQR